MINLWSFILKNMKERLVKHDNISARIYNGTYKKKPTHINTKYNDTSAKKPFISHSSISKYNVFLAGNKLRSLAP